MYEAVSVDPAPKAAPRPEKQKPVVTTRCRVTLSARLTVDTETIADGTRGKDTIRPSRIAKIVAMSSRKILCPIQVR